MKYRLEVYFKVNIAGNWDTYEEAHGEAKKITDDNHIIKLVMVDNDDEVIGREIVT
jgi:hypothetical protein